MDDYVIGICNTPAEVDATAWDALLHSQAQPTPFMRHAYLHALHASGSANTSTGWNARFITLHQRNALVAAAVLYIKSHSMGEYVFDWAWANAYQQHGLSYYPKGLLAVPFTPVPASKLLARDAPARSALLYTLLELAQQWQLSSLHLLFTDAADLAAAQQAGMLLRHTVQFHWSNSAQGYADFDSFLATLAQDKRKKIRQERRKVREAGVSFRHVQGRAIAPADWEFFYRCYERTYLEHGNAPYLSRGFFARMAQAMPENWLLFVADRQGRPIASSLIALTCPAAGEATATAPTAYGRYWGALERVDCLHFEACYYQPLEWCIAHGYQRFEGGAQGEHKMARALLPVQTTSAHWIAHPEFSRAIANFLGREAEGIDNYMEELRGRSPFRQETGET
ncbi:MAG: GNAT family N-acetyltransferase [Rhodoferax sp.]|nr:GNAT family N-acetyltransferase [Rhodoferax sp.]